MPTDTLITHRCFCCEWPVSQKHLLDCFSCIRWECCRASHGTLADYIRWADSCFDILLYIFWLDPAWFELISNLFVAIVYPFKLLSLFLV